MRVERFSAVENFGVPIEDLSLIYTLEGLLRLMGQYSIDGTDVSDDVVDITPPYWSKNKFKYMLSRVRPDGPAVVEMLPVTKDAQTVVVASASPNAIVAAGILTRRLEIPTDMPAMPLTGPSPRYAGMLCVHELVALTES